MTPHRKIVSTWPSYLLKRIPPHLRSAISADACERDVSVQDIVRGHLCKRLSLHCPPESSRYDSDRDSRTSEQLLLRLQPKLHRAIVRTSAEAGQTMREIILETLEAHYEGREI
jgi:predicted HicB family RNase H-like nuclease